MERKITKLLAMMLASSLLLGCGANTALSGKAQQDKVYEQRGMEISKVVSEMSDTLAATMKTNLYNQAVILSEQNDSDMPERIDYPAVAVTSFVDTDTYEDAGYLGRELGELFIHELDRRQIPVREFKTTGNLSVTKEGEIVFSRNWKKLATSARITNVLAGTITRNEEGVVLVGRVINMRTSEVIGSTTGFIPYDRLPFCYRTAQKNCSLNGTASYTAADINMKSQLNSVAGYTPGVAPATTNGKNVPSTSATAVNTGVQADDNPRQDKYDMNKVLHHDPEFNSKYYPQGAKVPATSTGNYEEFLYNNRNSLGKGCLITGCQDAVVYPAATYQMGKGVIRDVHDQSQYSRTAKN